MALIVILISIIYRGIFTYLYTSTGNEIYDILRRQIFGQLSFFYTGMLIYFVKDFFIRNIWTILVAGIALKLLLPLTSVTLQIIVEPFAISAIVMALSLLPYDIKWLRHRNNISYEMYLFHFPIIQLGLWLGICSSGIGPLLAYVFIATSVLSLVVHICIERWLSFNRH